MTYKMSLRDSNNLLTAYLDKTSDPACIIESVGRKVIYSNARFDCYDIEQILCSKGFSRWRACGVEWTAVEMGDVTVVTGTYHSGSSRRPSTTDELAWLDQIEKSSNVPIEREHIRFLRSFEWTATELGDMSMWGTSLRTAYSILMNNPFPCALYWGPNLICIYNFAFTPLLGAVKHPWMLGKPYWECWPEIWDTMKPILRDAVSNLRSVHASDGLLMINRHGWIEETYFSWGVVPIIGDEGSCAGLWNLAFDRTKHVLEQRRIRLQKQIYVESGGRRMKDRAAFFKSILKTFEEYPLDIPFALLYCVETGYVDGIGINGKPAESFKHQIEEVGYEESRVVEDISDLRPVLLDDQRGFKHACREAFLMPIGTKTSAYGILAYLVIGLSAVRPFDANYKLFFELLSHQLNITLENVASLMDAEQRGEKLEEELGKLTIQLSNSELRFSKMASISSTGIFNGNDKGEITYANAAWEEISGHPASSPGNWLDSVHDDDRDRVERKWRRAREKCRDAKTEFRWKTPLQGMERWCLATVASEKLEDGTFGGFTGAIMCITERKAAERYQQQRAEEAIELKRQQEYFIDMTSHELRNPLTALVQGVELVRSGLGTLSGLLNVTSSESSIQNMSDCITETVTTISDIDLCASHMQRIINDIINASKLEAGLLLITPIKCEPIHVARNVLQMFEAQTKLEGIDVGFHLDPSLTAMNISWVLMDPTRFSQILINLLHNAIKYLHKQPEKWVDVRLSSSDTPPTQVCADRKLNGMRSQPVYLICQVADNGPGLPAAERASLFQKLKQVGTKTHVKYGASRMGLYISQQLTRLQGGDIFVNEDEGQGLTMTFFIKVVQASDIEASLKPLAPPSIAPLVKRGSTKLPGTSVLIVEDNLINQRLLQRQLQTAGFAASIANHGQEMLDKLESSTLVMPQSLTTYNIILLDIEMPVMDGMTAVRHVRTWEKEGKAASHIPIIAVSANARPEQINEQLQAGADDSVTKPFRLPELLTKMRHFIS